MATPSTNSTASELTPAMVAPVLSLSIDNNSQPAADTPTHTGRQEASQTNTHTHTHTHTHRRANNLLQIFSSVVRRHVSVLVERETAKIASRLQRSDHHGRRTGRHGMSVSQSSRFSHHCPPNGRDMDKSAAASTTTGGAKKRKRPEGSGSSSSAGGHASVPNLAKRPATTTTNVLVSKGPVVVPPRPVSTTSAKGTTSHAPHVVSKGGKASVGPSVVTSVAAAAAALPTPADEHASKPGEAPVAFPTVSHFRACHCSMTAPLSFPLR